MERIRKTFTLAAMAALALPAASQHLGSWDFWEDNVGDVEATMLRAVHAMLLPDGSILAFNREIGRFTGTPRRYEVLEAFRAVRLVPTGSGTPWWERDYTSFDIMRSYRQSADVFDRELFCAGHVLQANGHAHIIGGHTKVIERQGDDDVLVRDNVGQPYVMVFRPHVGSYSFFMRSNAARGRWYPTPVVLPNSDIFTFAGTYWNGQEEAPNRWPTLHTHDTSTGQESYRHDFASGGTVSYTMQPYYPFVFVDPTVPSTDPESGGKLYHASRAYTGFTHSDLEINLATLESPLQRNADATKVANDYPSAAMLDDKIILSGGAMSASTDAVQSTFMIDLATTGRAWQGAPSIPNMTRKRKNHTLVPLPTGDLIAMGGHRFGNANHDDRGAFDALTPEVWRPGLAAWTPLVAPPDNPPSQQRRRGYHSTTMLLPDGRVWLAGGDPPSPNDLDPDEREKQRTVNIFSPPYGGFSDWHQRRPLIEAHPAEMHYGRDYPMQVRLDASTRDLKHVVLVAMPSATHAFDVGARLRTLQVSNLTREGNVVSFRVHAPSDPAQATPGYYMLFAVDKLGSGTPPLLDGVPSRAKIIRLRDYDRIDLLQEAGIALDGQSGFAINPSPNQLLLRDNDRLGLNITTGVLPTGSQLLLTGQAPYANARDFRLQMEWHATSNCIFRVEMYNYTTDQWVLFHGPTTELFPNPVDRFFHYAQLDTIVDPHPFIHPTMFTVRMRLTWIDADPIPSQFNVNIDYVRWGIRR